MTTLPTEAALDPQIIYLQPNCCAHRSYEGRQWCEDDVWEECECDKPMPSVKYVLASTSNSALVDAERERCAQIADWMADSWKRAREAAPSSQERQVGWDKWKVSEAIAAAIRATPPEQDRA